MSQQTNQTDDLHIIALEHTLARLEGLGAAEITSLAERDNAIQVYSQSRKRHFHLRVRASRSGEWTVPISEGRAPEETVNDNEFWVLIDYLGEPAVPEYYLVPGSWLRRQIHAGHQQSLADAGELPVEAGEQDYLFLAQNIENWKDQWDQMGL